MTDANESGNGGAGGPLEGSDREAADRPDLTAGDPGAAGAAARDLDDTAERPAVRAEVPADDEAPGDSHDAPDDTTRPVSPLVAAVAAARAREENAAGPDGADEESETGVSAAAPRSRRRGRFVAVGVLAVLLLLGGLYAGAYAIAGDKVARGTTVAGVDIGGQTRDEAVATLEDALAERETRPLQVAVEETSVAADLAPAQVSLAVDHEESVAAAGGRRSWSPARLWGYFTGGKDLPAVVTSDAGAVDEFLTGLEESAGQAPVEGAIAFPDGQVQVTEPAAGRGFDREAATTALEEAYVAEDPAAALELVEVTPEIDRADIDAALADFAEPAVSAPVTLVFGETPVTLQPAEYAPALSMVVEDGALVGRVDGEVLRQVVDGRVGDPGRPQDASIEIQDGAPVVVPAQPGVDYLPETLAEVFTTLVTAADGSREGTIEAEAVEPEFTTEDAEALGVVEEVSEFTTYYPHAAYRNTNIGRAAELVDGTLLQPGETFSLNDTTGERTYENGFTDGFIISNGVFRSEPGGGVSQMATTTFNAAYFAGLEDVQHKPHSLYIDRYPEGREATVAWPTVDLQFKNDTEYGVLVQAVLSPSSPGNRGSITVRMWSTKVWDVESDVSGRYAYTDSSTRTLTTSDCQTQSGSRGFSVDYDRIFKRPGTDEVVKREDFSWTYSPTPTIRCEQPQPDPPPAPAPSEQPSQEPAPEQPPSTPADPEG